MDEIVTRAEPSDIVYVVYYRLQGHDEWELIPLCHIDINDAFAQQVEIRHGYLGVTPDETLVYSYSRPELIHVSMDEDKRPELRRATGGPSSSQ
jgi:hypothetical protein